MFILTVIILKTIMSANKLRGLTRINVVDYSTWFDYTTIVYTYKLRFIMQTPFRAVIPTGHLQRYAL